MRAGPGINGSRVPATTSVGLHSPTLWLIEANQGLLDDLDLLECDGLERRCAELAEELERLRPMQRRDVAVVPKSTAVVVWQPRKGGR